MWHLPHQITSVQDLADAVRRADNQMNMEKLRTAMELVKVLRSVRMSAGFDIPDKIGHDEHEAAAYRVALRVITDYLDKDK